jgi:spermidine/putrescine transport system permease protein
MRSLRRSVLRFATARSATGSYLLLLPGALWLLSFFLLPLLMMFVHSFLPIDESGARAGFTLEHYQRFITGWDYRQIFVRTLLWSGGATAICAGIGYPVAYAISRSGRLKNLLLFLVVLPFWTSFLVRTFAMIFLLTGEGFLNATLGSLGVAPLDLLNTPLAVMTGLVYCHLPFMVLPVYASLEKLDRTLLEAAAALGARPASAFFRITLPLSRPGLVAGSVLVFVLTLGSFLISDLLGPPTMMMGNVIDQQFKVTRNWPFGAAASFVVMALVLVPTLIYLRSADRAKRGP